MLKEIAKFAREQLLKIDWIRREVEARQAEKERQQQDKRFIQIMRISRTLHLVEPDGPDTDVVVDYVDSRMVGQRHVTPIIIRPFGLKKEG